jgi:short-subunit dehydrogenase
VLVGASASGKSRLLNIQWSATAGRTIASLPADLGTDEGRERVIARAGQIGIDLLINNAGIEATCAQRRL